MPIKRNNGLVKAVLGNVPIQSIYYGDKIVYGEDITDIFDYELAVNPFVTPNYTYVKINSLKRTPRNGIVIVPERIDGYKVDKIISLESNSVRKIVIEAKGDVLNDSALKNCVSLEELDIPVAGLVTTNEDCGILSYFENSVTAFTINKKGYTICNNRRRKENGDYVSAATNNVLRWAYVPSSLKKITVRERVGYSGFSGITPLEHIVLPPESNKLVWGISYLPSLQTLKYTGDTYVCPEFSNTNRCTIYVPNEYLSNFQNVFSEHIDQLVGY